ncbi:MAG: hypothetical protein COB17_01870 [Sulfurimonas sp.]|nr:MAG: hypothetical protein COB17_01870 [Sulfurimonas sp.]
MNFSDVKLPMGAIKVGETPSMTEKNVIKGLLKNHLAPKGKFGYIVVEEGSLQYFWEDDKENIIDADINHPIVIEPERYHSVVMSGEVLFRVEFYKVANIFEKDKAGDRPGEVFCECFA